MPKRRVEFWSSGDWWVWRNKNGRFTKGRMRERAYIEKAPTLPPYEPWTPPPEPEKPKEVWQYNYAVNLTIWHRYYSARNYGWSDHEGDSDIEARVKQSVIDVLKHTGFRATWEADFWGQDLLKLNHDEYADMLGGTRGLGWQKVDVSPSKIGSIDTATFERDP